jgi:hydroxymethylbilane synthase
MQEHRNDGGKLYSLLSQLTHAKTVEEVFRERKAFKEFGGGCHLAVGIHVKKIHDQFLHVHAGEIDGKRIEKKWLEGNVLPPIAKKKLFVGLPQGEKKDIIYDQFLKKMPSKNAADLHKKNVFVTSRYCLPLLETSIKSAPSGLWAAGTKTAKKMTKAGFWINGTSDSLGTEDLEAMKTSKALLILDPTIKDSWAVLSHHNATSDLGQVVGCYDRIENDVAPEYENELRSVGACYWTSFPQYETFLSKFPFLHDAQHFCGLGKTWQEFNKAQVKVHTVASMEEFYSLV